MLIGIFFSCNTVIIKMHHLQIYLVCKKMFFYGANHKAMIKINLFFFTVDVCFSHVCKIINKDKNMMVALLDGTKKHLITDKNVKFNSLKTLLCCSYKCINFSVLLVIWLCDMFTNLQA